MPDGNGGPGGGGGDNSIYDLLCQHLRDEMPYMDPSSVAFLIQNITSPNVNDPTGNPASDKTCVNRFGPLQDFGKSPPCAQNGLQVQLNGPTAESVDPRIDEATIDATASWLTFKNGATFRITKGFRFPYTYKDINGKPVYTNLFVLFSGSGQS
jgi:hypothetical protein